MTTITIDRALLELADKFSEGWHDGIKIDASDVMLLTEAANEIERLRAELAKPSAPAWHDAPTEPGIWLCDEGGPDCYTYTAHNIVLLNDPALKDDECRWYGPIPQDMEGEKS